MTNAIDVRNMTEAEYLTFRKNLLADARKIKRPIIAKEDVVIDARLMTTADVAELRRRLVRGR